jgi:hypothetical protein
MLCHCQLFWIGFCAKQWYILSLNEVDYFLYAPTASGSDLYSGGAWFESRPGDRMREQDSRAVFGGPLLCSESLMHWKRMKMKQRLKHLKQKQILNIWKLCWFCPWIFTSCGCGKCYRRFVGTCCLLLQDQRRACVCSCMYGLLVEQHHEWGAGGVGDGPRSGPLGTVGREKLPNGLFQGRQKTSRTTALRGPARAVWLSLSTVPIGPDRTPSFTFPPRTTPRVVRQENMAMSPAGPGTKNVSAGEGNLPEPETTHLDPEDGGIVSETPATLPTSTRCKDPRGESALTMNHSENLFITARKPVNALPVTSLERAGWRDVCSFSALLSAVVDIQHVERAGVEVTL